MTLAKKILFSLLTLSIFLAVLETALKLFGPFYPTRVLCHDFILGDVYCPNSEGWLHGNIKKYIKINSEGLVDDEYPIARTAGKLRVAVLGDSFAAAEEVSAGKKFHDIWERRLPALLDRPVEVINFGLRGKGTWEELQIFHLKAKKYRPDLTALVFFWGNDIENNLLALENQRFNPLRNEYPEPSVWERFLIRRRNFNKWLWNHSALYQFMRTRYNDLEFRTKSYFRAKYTEAAAPSRTRESSTGDEAPVRARKDNPDFILDDKYFFDSEGWGLTQTLLLRLRDEVEKIGSRFLVIHFTGHDNFRLDMPFPRGEFNAFLERERIQYVDLFPKLGDMGDDSNENLIPDDFHFSETGHRNFAQFTLDSLAEILADKQ